MAGGRAGSASGVGGSGVLLRRRELLRRRAFGGPPLLREGGQAMLLRRFGRLHLRGARFTPKSVADASGKPPVRRPDAPTDGSGRFGVEPASALLFRRAGVGRGLGVGTLHSSLQVPPLIFPYGGETARFLRVAPVPPSLTREVRSRLDSACRVPRFWAWL